MARLVVIALTVALLAIPMLAISASAATPKCMGFKATIVGNDKANILKGTNGRDVIVAKGGRDKIYGRGGNDIVCAGQGNDTVIAGAGKDKVLGMAGNDQLKGGAGFDTINGGLGKDGCYANEGGAKVVNCEPADLRLTVGAPAQAFGETSDDPFSISVRVKNIGARTASGVELELAYDEVGVTCRLPDDPSGTIELGELKPKHFKDEFVRQDCQVPMDKVSGTVTLEASASTSSWEKNLANNEDESSTTVVRSGP